MSLIYDALRGAGESTPAPATKPTTQLRPWQALPRYSVWLVLGVVLAGPIGFLVARSVANNPVQPMPPTPAVARQAVAVGPEPAEAREAANADAASTPAELPPLAAIEVATRANTSVLTDAAAPGELPSRQPVEPMATDMVAPTAAGAAPVQSSAPSLAAANSTPPATPQAPSIPPSMKISVRTAGGPTTPSGTRSSPGEEPDGAVVRAAMARLQAAVGEKDAAARALAMDELRSVLPADSLTLLRAQAWNAHGSDDLKLAEQYYRAILQRVPDDEYAGVNLALIEAHAGQIEQARDRLNRLAARNSRSTMVNRALAELEVATQ